MTVGVDHGGRDLTTEITKCTEQVTEKSIFWSADKERKESEPPRNLRTHPFLVFLRVLRGSKRRFKCMERVADLRLASLGPDDGNDVEPGRGLRDAVTGQVELGGLGELVPLHGVDLIFGGRIVHRAGFDFDENQRLTVLGHDVNFPQIAAEIADDDRIAGVAQISGGDVLAPLAERITFGAGRNND